MHIIGQREHTRTGLTFQVEVDERVKFLAEFCDYGRLAHLPGTAQNQRLVPFSAAPLT